MGKYTSLARRVKQTKPHERGEPSTSNILNININNIHNNKVSTLDKPPSDRPESTLEGSFFVETSQNGASGSKGVVREPDKHATNLRTTNLTNLFPEDAETEEVWVAVSRDPRRYTNLARKERALVRCIHNIKPDECDVCSGYVRWLIADEDRIRRMHANPEAVRREFWRSVGGES